MKYKSKTASRQYQSHWLEKTFTSEGFCFLWDMGLGKSKAAIDTAGSLYTAGKIDSFILIVRKNLKENWQDEISKHLNCLYRTYIWEGLKTKKEKAELLEVKNFDGLRIFILGTQAFQSNSIDVKMTEFFKGIDLKNTLVTIDEATDIKTHDANRTKLIKKYFSPAKYKRALTGTAIPERPTDCFSILDFAHPNLWRGLGFKNFFAFRNYFCRMEDKRLGSKTFKVVSGYKNLDKLREIILDSAIGSYLTKEQVAKDLPENPEPKIIHCDLNPEQLRLYNSMKNDLKAEIDGDELLLTSALHKYFKLHQITCGVLHTKENEHVIDGTNEKLSALITLIDDNLPRKTVVFSMLPSTKIVEMVGDRLKKEFGEEAVVMYTGKTKQEDRQELVRQFQDPESPVKIFLGNNAASYGITLTAANQQIYYSLYYSNAEFEQSMDRCRRIGQKYPLSVYYLLSRGTEDMRILRALREKQKVIDYILGEK